MKITTFNPQIVTNNADSIVKLFEELGFEKRHLQEGIGTLDVTGIRMKDANGFNLDISQPNVSIPQDTVSIRMNVDNFEEAYEILISHGFKNIYGDRALAVKTSKFAMMISPSGYMINLVEHIKNN